ncbi:MAG: ribosomal protein N(5)-glutamine methyltransferase [Burkholderiales bacterium]|jgi:ribosomal protein L3 glutamine methyltransferase|nr:ribosomal protein N(5)-glutamine methyltransferase [Burkholderiales bacterium]
MTIFKLQVFNHAAKKLSTIRDLLRFAVSMFQKHHLYFGHGTDNAYDEASYLILHTLHLPLDQLDPYLDAKLLDDEITAVLKVLHNRVVKRLPAPYITNEAHFLGYSFYVDERVIIPRSYLGEILVNGSLEAWIEYPELIHNVLDLCTGNGSLAIIAADCFPDAEVIASDISSDALEVASQNIAKYELQDRITLQQSNLFAKLKKRKFDLILTNPPYVDKSRMDNLPEEYRHEPHLALSGGGDGLVLVDNILKNASMYLTGAGILLLEMGDNRLELEERYPGLNFAWLDTENEQGFVFVLTAADLKEYFAKKRKA